jgi:hypothetical protein
MTYMTLSIRLYSKSAVAFDLTSPSAESEPVIDLNNLARQCGPHQLSSWAKRHNLNVFYVDNCWVRVPASRSELEKFASEVLEKPDLFGTIGPDPDDGGRYVISSEEF